MLVCAAGMSTSMLVKIIKLLPELTFHTS
ncbi:TPA: hypothetical protein ACHYK1_002759 [Escherichia coli]